MYEDFVIDLETLDTEPTAVILSIGIVAFNVHEFDNVETITSQWRERQYYEFPKMQEQIDMGRTISFSTLHWWNEQSALARNEAFKPEGNRLHGERIAKNLRNFIESRCLDAKRVRLWGNGSSFDNVILRSYLKTFGEQIQIPWWQDRDMRTVKEFNQAAPAPEMGLTAHVAINDAIHEAMVIQRCLNGDPDEN